MKYSVLILFSLTILSCSEKKDLPSVVKVSSGRVERIENFNSNYVSPRNVDIWLPEGYSNKKEYSVLYMHDGQMLFDSTSNWNKQEWSVDEVVGDLIKEGKIRETIVVGIWNTKQRHSEYFPQKPFEMLNKNYTDSLLNVAKQNPETALFAAPVQSDNYLKFLVTELKPYIDEHYPVNPAKTETFIAGSSMGGLISVYAICEYPEIFEGAICMSTHWIGTFSPERNPIPGTFVNYLKNNLPKPDDHKLYFDFGTETLDSFYEPFQEQVDSVLISKGFNENNWITKKFPGAAHSEKDWGKRLNVPLIFMLGKKK
jgi:predicted alpha/beta superfamily hydrolase